MEKPAQNPEENTQESNPASTQVAERPKEVQKPASTTEKSPILTEAGVHEGHEDPLAKSEYVQIVIPKE